MTTISSVSNDYLANQIYSISSTLNNSTQTTSGISTSSLGTDSKEISKPGDFFNKLQTLQQTDPAKFKETVSKIADQLESASKDSSMGNATNMLSDLATKFRSVANGGDISQLQPPKPPSDDAGVSAVSGASDSSGTTATHKHHHHHKAAEQYSQQDQSSSSTDMITGASSQQGAGDKVKALMDQIFNEVGASTSTSAVA